MLPGISVRPASEKRRPPTAGSPSSGAWRFFGRSRSSAHPRRFPALPREGAANVRKSAETAGCFRNPVYNYSVSLYAFNETAVLARLGGRRQHTALPEREAAYEREEPERSVDAFHEHILVDKTRFSRVLLNLGTNAIKYTQSGGQVRLTATQLEREEGDTRYYQFTVSDNGMGMSEEFQQHMFEEFAREVNTTTSGIQGTGLGLSVTKAFVDIMGGTIRCESKLGQGTTFTVVFPMAVREEAAEEADRDASQNDPSAKLKGKRVLLVEDNELNREIATDILQDEAGLIVETAEDGTVAVDLMRKMGANYVDFILMDIQMPYMNGYDATKAIRAMYPNQHIPIIALSANAFAEDRQKSLEAGMDDHIEKPIEVAHLFAAMSRFV